MTDEQKTFLYSAEMAEYTDGAINICRYGTMAEDAD